jgi:hypothetical protein
LLAKAVDQLALILNVPPPSLDRRPEQARSNKGDVVLLDDFLALDRLLQRLDAAFLGGVELQLHLFDIQ